MSNFLDMYDEIEETESLQSGALDKDKYYMLVEKVLEKGVTDEPNNVAYARVQLRCLNPETDEPTNKVAFGRVSFGANKFYDGAEKSEADHKKAATYNLHVAKRVRRGLELSEGPRNAPEPELYYQLFGVDNWEGRKAVFELGQDKRGNNTIRDCFTTNDPQYGLAYIKARMAKKAAPGGAAPTAAPVL